MSGATRLTIVALLVCAAHGAPLSAQENDDPVGGFEEILRNVARAAELRAGVEREGATSNQGAEFRNRASGAGRDSRGEPRQFSNSAPNSGVNNGAGNGANSAPNGGPQPGASQPRPDWPARTLSLAVTLGDGRIVRGRTRIQAPDRLALVHTVEGVRYEKIVALTDIRSIEVKRWRGRQVRATRDGNVFQFDVDRVAITLADGGVLLRDGPLPPFFLQFDINNQHGQVRFFTFWLDLQKSDGRWYTGIEGPATGERVVGHADVIKRISFDRESAN